LLKMDQESVSDYIAWLDAAYQQAYKNGEIELDDYYKYQEEVFDKIKESLDDLQKAHENAITFDKIKLDNAIEAGDYPYGGGDCRPPRLAFSHIPFFTSSERLRL